MHSFSSEIGEDMKMVFLLGTSKIFVELRVIILKKIFHEDTRRKTKIHKERTDDILNSVPRKSKPACRQTGSTFVIRNSKPQSHPNESAR